MEFEGLEVATLTPGKLERYFVWRRRQGYLKSLSPLSLRRLLGYLDGLGVLPAGDAVVSPVEQLLTGFRRYLLEERGMTVGSAKAYEPAARLLLSERAEPLVDDLGAVVRCRGQRVRVAGGAPAFGAVGGDGGLCAAGAAAVLARARVDRRAAR